MKQSVQNGARRRMDRRDRTIQEHVHDTYKMEKKLHEPTVCGECAAVYKAGRWQWGRAPAKAERHQCPACQRIKDHYPAGLVRLHGPFVAARLADIVNLVRHETGKQKEDHPLKRIMDIKEIDDGLEISTTDMHLARHLGESVHHAYGGELRYRYPKKSSLIRVDWVDSKGKT